MNSRQKLRSAHSTFRDSLLCALVLVFAFLALPSSASADKAWQLKVRGVWVDPTTDFLDIDLDGDRVATRSNGDIGFGLALERRFNPRIGVEIGAVTAKPDLSLDATLAGFRFDASDRVDFTALTVGLNVHLTPSRAVDLYLGPLVAYTIYGDVGLDVPIPGGTLEETFSSEDDFALGAQLGADFCFGDSPWSVHLEAQYLDTTLKVTDREGEESDLGFEPILLNFGIGYRF